MGELTVPANVLRAASLFVYPKEDRKVITYVSVYIAPGEFEVAATDSYKLFCHTSPNFKREESTQLFLPPEATDILKSSDAYVSFDVANDTVTMCVTNKKGAVRTTLFKREQFSYPAYWNLYKGMTVLPGFDDGLNGDFLIAVVKAAKEYIKKDPTIDFNHLDNNSAPLIATLPQVNDDVFMLVMPVRR